MSQMTEVNAVNRLPFEQIGEMVPGGFFVCYAENSHDLIYSNRRVAEIFGCDNEEEFKQYVNNSFHGMVYGHEFNKVVESISNQLRDENNEGKFGYAEYQIKRKDGRFRVLVNHGKLVYDPVFGPVITVFVEDTTEALSLATEVTTRQYVDALQVLSSEYDSVYKVDLDMDIGIAYRLNGKAVEKAEEMHPHKYSELMRWCLDNIVERGREEMEIMLDIPNLIAMLTKKETAVFRYQARTNGLLRHYEIKIVKASDFEHYHSVIMAFSDIQDKVTYEEQMAEHKTNELLRVVAEDYICLFDVDLQSEKEIKYSMDSSDGILPQWSDSNDYSTAINDYANLLIVEEDRERFLQATTLSALRKWFETKNEMVIEYNVKSGDKDFRFQGRFVLSSNTSAEPHMYIGIRNITDEYQNRTKVEKALHDALAAAETASRAKTSFLFNMSHDIRTPMNAISGFMDRLEKHIDDPVKVKDYIRKIRSASEFLLSLINNVLQMARIESGKLEIDEVPWNAEEFNDTIFTIFDTQMKEKGLQFTRSISIEHPYVYCDTVKLREIFLNLLSNALKYTPAGGKVSMELTELPSLKEGYTIYQTKISDTGIGMSSEYIPMIFDEFSRERTSTDSFIQGTGLGMAIVKSYVELMNGTISVESEVGKGTTFVVNIPHKIAEKTEDTSYMKGMPTEDIFTGKRILLAEDNELNAEIAMELLQEVGFEVDWAKDGVNCVSMMEKTPPDYYQLILMDIQMPNMNGYKATELIRLSLDAKKSSIPIIAMTANAFEEDIKDALFAGMNAHLSKPINVPKMLDTIAGVLQNCKNCLE